MTIKLKNMKTQPGTKLAVNEEGDVIAHVVKLDGEIVLDYVKTKNDPEAMIWPNDNDGKPLKTFKQGLEFVQDMVDANENGGFLY